MERPRPMADDLDWLRERFRNPVVDQPYVNGNILIFRRAQPVREQSATALELVDQAAEIVTGIEDHARQIEARAQFLVKKCAGKNSTFGRSGRIGGTRLEDCRITSCH